eukprot:1158863-Pyramimonas_sp.AAC.1
MQALGVSRVPPTMMKHGGNRFSMVGPFCEMGFLLTQSERTSHSQSSKPNGHRLTSSPAAAVSRRSVPRASLQSPESNPPPHREKE